MAKKKESEKGEQLDLIDVTPDNAKELVKAAKLYKKYQAARIEAGVKEADQKAVVLELMKAANLQPLAGGKIKYEHDDFKITVTPRDELVQVNEKKQPAEPPID